MDFLNTDLYNLILNTKSITTENNDLCHGSHIKHFIFEGYDNISMIKSGNTIISHIKQHNKSFFTEDTRNKYNNKIFIIDISKISIKYFINKLIIKEIINLKWGGQRITEVQCICL